MQHLGNTRLSDVNRELQYVRKGLHWEDHLYQQLSDVGIRHGDLHTGNIMFYKGRGWAIDFGSCIEFLTNEKEREKA